MSAGQNKVRYRVETVYDVDSLGGGVREPELDRCLNNFREEQVIGAPIWETLHMVVTTEPRHAMGVEYRQTVVKVSVDVAPPNPRKE